MEPESGRVAVPRVAALFDRDPSLILDSGFQARQNRSASVYRGLQILG
jgi:hypothetical protein